MQSAGSSGSAGTASTRVPYRAESTPPRAPARLHSPSRPLRSPLSLAPASSDYPESPTRGPRRLPSPSPIRSVGPSYILTKPKGLKSTWRPPRFWKTTRRVILSLVVLAILLVTSNSSTARTTLPSLLPDAAKLRALRARWLGEKSVDDGICRFVSPVEAYHRDLDRLRRLYPHKISSQYTLTSPHQSNHSQHSNHSDHSHSTPHTHHVFSPTGHLHVSPDPSAPHPIPLLLSLGENRWEELLSRQSRTLEEAVEEYIRRYGRRPPKGFDIWWDFAMTHNLVLPDEYDRINLDLAPFFALPKEEMRRRMDMVENMPETFTLVVKDGRVSTQILDPGGLKWDGTRPRARDASSLLDVFARFLPDLRATFSIFDQPQIYLSWARRGSLVDLGLRGEHTTHLQETDSAHVRLARSCPPDSNLRTNATTYSGRSFIYDSLEAGDLCQNPYVVPLHGLTLEPHGHDSHPKPHTQLLPLFSLAKTSINSDILITPLDQFYDSPGKDLRWEDKPSSKLAWRGSPTGMSMMSKDLDWRQAHRIRLHHFTNNHTTGTSSFIVPDLGQDIDNEDYPRPVRSQAATAIESKDALGGKVDEETTIDTTDFFFDTKLAGGPLQCSDGDGTCTQMWQEIGFAPYQPPEELNKHKFLLDIDGNGWSGRFRRLMSTNSVVIKASLFTEWFQPHLIPWFMYIPAKLDFSDLTDILAFFRGSPKHPELAFDETAKALAKNGKCFAERMFRLEDLQAYMMRLFLEYARLAADEGVDMDFYLEELVQESELEEGIYGDVQTSQEDFALPINEDGSSLLVDDPSLVETPLDDQPAVLIDLPSTEGPIPWFSVNEAGEAIEAVERFAAVREGRGGNSIYEEVKAGISIDHWGQGVLKRSFESEDDNEGSREWNDQA